MLYIDELPPLAKLYYIKQNAKLFSSTLDSLDLLQNNIESFLRQSDLVIVHDFESRGIIKQGNTKKDFEILGIIEVYSFNIYFNYNDVISYISTENINKDLYETTLAKLFSIYRKSLAPSSMLIKHGLI